MILSFLWLGLGIKESFSGAGYFDVGLDLFWSLFFMLFAEKLRKRLMKKLFG